MYRSNNDMLIDVLSIDEYHNSRQQNNCCRSDNMPSQLLDVVDEGHLPGLRGVAFIKKSVKQAHAATMILLKSREGSSTYVVDTMKMNTIPLSQR